jgi:hypothetical protein
MDEGFGTQVILDQLTGQDIKVVPIGKLGRTAQTVAHRSLDQRSGRVALFYLIDRGTERVNPCAPAEQLKPERTQKLRAKADPFQFSPHRQAS